MFSINQFIGQSLRYHWRLNLAVGLGVMVGTAVLTGALLIGDSVRGSLRDLTLQRLGNIDSALLSDRFFREDLAAEMMTAVQDDPQAKIFESALPAVLLPGTVEKPDPSGTQSRRAGQITLLGVTPEFFEVGEVQPTSAESFSPPNQGEVVLNLSLARELVEIDHTVEDELAALRKALIGSEVLVRLPEISQIPRDSTLGRKTDVVGTQRVKVSAIIDDRGLGLFNLRPSQQTPQNAYLALQTVQKAVGQYNSKTQRGYVNTVLFTKPDRDQPSSEDAREGLLKHLNPTFEDYGLQLDKTQQGYFNLTSQRMLIDPAVVNAAYEIEPNVNVQVAMTYLANTIAVGEREIPYSTITGLVPTSKPPLGPFETQDGDPLGPLKRDEIALNSWAAEDLNAKIGDEVQVTFFEPESTHGELRTNTLTFRLTAIVELQGAAEDPLLTPEFPGITDKESIGRRGGARLDTWDPPFPFEEDRVREKDEDYWNAYRATPKAFVALATAKQHFGGRFGNVTSIRIRPSSPQQTVEELKAEFEQALNPTDMGFVLLDLKARQLKAASGSTPFDLLFFGFSMFIIAAAVMLVALLFQLNVEGRARQVGILLAAGITPRKVHWILSLEGLLVAALGGLLGVPLGIGYAAAMIAALTSPALWLAAINTPFLELHWTWQSLVIGYLSGVIVCGIAIFWSARKLGQVSVRRLLSGQAQPQQTVLGKKPVVSRAVAVVCLVGALALVPLGTTLQGEAQAGAFFGSGSLLLIAMLCGLWAWLQGSLLSGGVNFRSIALWRLAARNAARHPGRSVLTIGLVGAASFLIVALSAFRIDTSLLGPEKDSGNGGFTLVAQTDQPVLKSLNDQEMQFDAAPTAEAFELLQNETQVYPFRYKSGDDASCLNLFQTSQPLVLGALPDFIERGGFAWAGSLANSEETRDNPWLLLQQELDNDLVPVVLDAATAQYSLKIGLGSTYTMQDGEGKPLTVKVVGLLKNSVLQGGMIMSEEQFLEHFPYQNGYRFFLIETPPDKAQEVESIWESALGDHGFAAETTKKRLAEFLAVQNTYLLTFQSLGGLGLLLGTFGLAAVQMRNILERRGELALLRAAGFRKSRLAGMVMMENILLLLGGLGIGCIAALVAILSHLISGSAAVPYISLAITLGLVLLVGILAGLIAVRNALSVPILSALRSE